MNEHIKIVVAVGHLGAEPRGELVGDMIRTMELEELHKHAREVADQLGGALHFIADT